MGDPLLQKLFRNDLHHMDGFYSEVACRVPERGRVLDLGCGDMANLDRFRSATCEVWGTDFHQHPRLEHPEWFRLMGEDQKIPYPDDFFDAVVCISVMEHVTKPQDFLAEVGRVLRPNGHFVGHSISGSHYVTWIRRALGVLPHSLNQTIVKRLYGRDEIDTFPAYYRLNTERAIERIGKDRGLELVMIRRYADPNYFGFSRPLLKLAIVTDWALAKIASGWGRLYFTATLKATNDNRTERKLA